MKNLKRVFVAYIRGFQNNQIYDMKHFSTLSKAIDFLLKNEEKKFECREYIVEEKNGNNYKRVKYYTL